MRNLLKAIILFVAIFPVTAYSQNTNLHVQVFKKDTSFTCIALDASDNVFAGTNGKGLFKYDKTIWKKWNLLQPAFSRSNLRQLAIKGNDVWVASSGYVLFLGSGEAGNNINFYGGAFKLDANYALKSTYYKGRPVLGQAISGGPPTRNVLGMYIDNTGVPWCAASYHDSVTYPAIVNYNARYHYAPGAVGRYNGQNFDFITGAALPNPTGLLIGVGNNYKDDTYSFGKRRVCRSITQVNNEMWVGSDGYDQADGNLITAGILRYDLSGNYLGKYDENNTGIPFGLTNSSFGPWSLYQDAKGRVWASMSGTRGIAVRDTNGVWTNIGIPPGFPSTVYRANAITGNSRGEVFFGTSNGLVAYKGTGSYTSDTSYALYTTANGLSSNSIAGVAVGKDESIWLATAAGVNKIRRGDLIVYNLFRDVLTPSAVTDDNFRRVIATYDSRKTQQDINKDTLFIAADSSKATIFKWMGNNPSGLKFRIKDAAAAYNLQQHGRFVTKYLDPVANDSLLVQYYHPSYIDDLYTVSTQFNGKNVRLEIVDTTVSPEVIVMDIPVKFVLPPVLLLHGIWSDKSTWDEMKEYLLTNGLYRYKSYEVFTPSYPSDRGFELNRIFISSYVDSLIMNCGENRMSAGKVDFVGHSMGGILSRLYLQEGVGGLTYKKNMHKLITINTPHSGSPLANIVGNKDDFFRWVLKQTGRNPNNGALNDLKIGYPPIDSLLNGPDLNKNIVPSHVIHTTDVLPAWVEFADGTINKFIKPSIKLKPAPYLNVIGTAIKTPNPYVLAIKAFLFSVKYWLMSNTSCSWNTPLNECLQRIYNGQSDLIVSDVSQIGGMNDAESYFDGFNHINVHTSPPAYIKTLELLRENANSALFSRNGFHPVKLQWNSVAGTQQLRNGVDSVRIINPAYGASVNRGDSVHIIVRATPGISKMLFAMSSENDLDAFALEAPDSVFSFKVSENVMSRINYKIFGFDAAGNVVTDSSYLVIGATPGILIDSIKIAHENIEDVKIFLGDSTQITVWGYFNDGVMRDITFQTQLTYSTLTGSVAASAFGDVKGLVLGFDELKANYLGFSDSMNLEVIPKITGDTVSFVLPIRFSGMQAQYNGKNVDVKWSTSFEQNNKHFEIEHSTTGNNFIKVGTVTATNNINGSNYSFVHTGFVTGKNYYRIRQVDLDGKTSYAPIAVALVNNTGKIILYPNPVMEQFTLDFKNAANNKSFKTARIINRLGQVIQLENIEAGSIQKTIKVAGLAPGIYNVEIIDAKGKPVYVETFVKYR